MASIKITFIDETYVPVVVCGAKDNTMDSDVAPSDDSDDNGETESNETLYDAAQAEENTDAVNAIDNGLLNSMDDEQPSTSTHGKSKRQYRWRNMVKKGHNMAENTEFTDHIQNEAIDTEASIKYFKMFFDEEMIDHVVHHTNLYNTQCSIDLRTASIVTSKNEIERYIGLLLKMAIIQAPYYRLYWESGTSYEPISSIMSRDRFELLKRFIHFNDNNNAPGRNDENRDRLFKIRPLFEKLRQNCLAQDPEEYNSIDEQMVPYKGRSFLRRYMPNKPHKWGFKIFSRNGITGMLYDFELEGAPDPTRPAQSVVLGYCGADIVLRLCEHLPKQKGYKLFFDNYFNFPELLVKLKEDKFWAVGTLRADRMRSCRMKSEKELKKEGRGSYDGAIDLNSGISVVRWFDNKAVQLASNYVFIEPVDKVQRWSKKEQAMINVTRPAVVNKYNAAMGGVDLFDMFRSLYRMDHKSRRWYIRIFYWTIASSVINAWIRYRKDCNAIGHPKKEQMNLLKFTLSVSNSLVTNAKPTTKRAVGRPRFNVSSESESDLDVSFSPKRRRRAPDVCEVEHEIRYDGYEHWPEHREERPKCFKCKEKTRNGCSKCKKALCLTKDRNCFVDFHKK